MGKYNGHLWPKLREKLWVPAINGGVSPTLIGGADNKHSARRVDDVVGDGGQVINVHETLDLHEEPVDQPEIAAGNSRDRGNRLSIDKIGAIEA
jgi:hypothetical protein